VSAPLALHAGPRDDARLQRLRGEDRVVVSEPMSELPGVWNEIPASTVLIVQPGPDEQRSLHLRFEPALTQIG
jgi:hypothetical protein